MVSNAHSSDRCLLYIAFQVTNRRVSDDAKDDSVIISNISISQIGLMQSLHIYLLQICIAGIEKDKEIDTWSLGHLLFYDVSINWLNLNIDFASQAKFKIKLNAQHSKLTPQITARPLYSGANWWKEGCLPCVVCKNSRMWKVIAPSYDLQWCDKRK